MKSNHFIILTIFLFSIAANASMRNQTNVQKDKKALNNETLRSKLPAIWNLTGNFPGGIIWQETFEGPASYRRWSSKDNTDPRPLPGPSEWIVNDWQGYDGSSWRCANLAFGDNGGYANHWYQVLDTPPLLLDEDAVFTFYHRYSCEEPVGASQGYDAWDGMNVRISTDGGNNWVVLPSSSYNVSSIWAFGHPTQGHNEGPGIPGWAGEMDNWAQESFDLSAYTSSTDSIRLRFAFASDMAYSTADGAPSLFGWQIDDIEVKAANKTFLSNYGVAQNLVGKSNEYIPPVGGDLWNIVKINEPFLPLLPEFTPFGRAANHALSCQNGNLIFNADSTYNPNMDNIIFTGPISVPETNPVYLDFKYIPFFFDGNSFPDVDYFRPEVSLDGQNWEFIEQQPYVYSFGFNEWLEFSWVYGYPRNMSMFDLSRFAGQDIYLSFRFWSDYDAPVGPGLLVDDIVLYSPTVSVPAVQNLAVDVQQNPNAIQLSWDESKRPSFYQIWRKRSDEPSFSFLGEQNTETGYTDSDIVPFYNYQYFVTSEVKYYGASQPSDTVEASINPDNTIELVYDDGHSNGSVQAAANKLLAVKFSPASFPIEFKALKIFLDTQNATDNRGQFAVYDDDGINGEPGTRLARVSYTGLIEGMNVIDFIPPVPIKDGDFFLTYKRYTGGPITGIDTDQPIDKRSFVETDSGWTNLTDYDIMIRALIDTSANPKSDFVSDISNPNPSINPEEFKFLKNYPNPFNPSTTLQFNIPIQLTNSTVQLSIYNVLGQKVRALFNAPAQPGINQLTWDGLNDKGGPVNSGIYLVQLSAGQQMRTQRILLMK